ncbi:MAG: hydrolase [Lentisphaerae bacterium]|nr:hydrolase [Lentisphaerota bacterium]
MLNVSDTLLLFVDVQGKLARLMHDRDILFDNLGRLIDGVRALDIPIVWLEQNPEKMGPTVPELAGRLEGLAPIPKMSFGCGGEPACLAAVERAGRRHVLIAGIETHVCVYQSALDLRDRGYTVHVAADAVSSRAGANKTLALDRMSAEGIRLTSVEMALLELLGTAAHPAFRDVLRIIK